MRLEKGINDLLTLYPDIAAEWDNEQNGELTPDQVTTGSHREVWWKCKNCGMRWKTSINHRTLGNGCPYDAGRLPITGKTDLATLYPDIAAEWDDERNDGLTPDQVLPHTHKRIWWRCKKCGERWEARVDNRTQGKGCPYDARRLSIAGKTDLATLYPNIAEEWDYERNGSLTPDQVTTASNRKVWWKCKNCGREWKATINHRTLGNSCPYDSGHPPRSKQKVL